MTSAVSSCLLVSVLSTSVVFLNSVCLCLTWLLSGLVLIAAGMIAVTVTILVKWVCVGKHKAADHPLWSAFVWLNELQDAFVETEIGRASCRERVWISKGDGSGH